MAEKEPRTGGTVSESGDVATLSRVIASRNLTYWKKAEHHRVEREIHGEEMVKLIAHWLLTPGQASETCYLPAVAMTTPSFAAFDPTFELWNYYWSRFQICTEANSISIVRQPKVFQTNENKVTSKLISTLAAQMVTLKGQRTWR